MSTSEVKQVAWIEKVIRRMVSAWCVVKSDSGRVGRNKEQ